MSAGHSSDAGAPASLAEFDMQEASRRFQSLWSSTFAMIQERNRLAHEIETSAEATEHAFLRTFPYYSRDKTIHKNIDTLVHALDTWQQRLSKGPGAHVNVPTPEQMNAWTSAVTQLFDLLAQTSQTMNDPSGSEMMYGVRAKYPNALKQPRDADEPNDDDDIAAKADTRLDMIQSIDTMPRTSHATSSTFDERDAIALLAQDEAWRDQDKHLEHLSASIGRQHSISMRMNEELELQSGIISGLDQDVEATGLRLGGAQTRLERFRESVREHGTYMYFSTNTTGSLWMIFVLIIILILLVTFVK